MKRKLEDEFSTFQAIFLRLQIETKMIGFREREWLVSRMWINLNSSKWFNLVHELYLSQRQFSHTIFIVDFRFLSNLLYQITSYYKIFPPWKIAQNTQIQLICCKDWMFLLHLPCNHHGSRRIYKVLPPLFETQFIFSCSEIQRTSIAIPLRPLLPFLPEFKSTRVLSFSESLQRLHMLLIWGLSRPLSSEIAFTVPCSSSPLEILNS